MEMRVRQELIQIIQIAISGVEYPCFLALVTFTTSPNGIDDLNEDCAASGRHMGIDLIIR